MSDASSIGRPRPRGGRLGDGPRASRPLFVVLVTLGVIAEAAGEPLSDIPRTPEGKPDFSGIWESMSGADYDLEPHAGREDAPPGPGVVVGHYLPYQPWAREQRDRNFAERATADYTRLNCYTLGVPRSVYYPAPFQIFQRPRDLTIVTQFGAVRTIHTNGTLHPEGPFGFWLGDSRGHWEGDTLVVETTHLREYPYMRRLPNTDTATVTERIRIAELPDRQGNPVKTLVNEMTLTDPRLYTQPVKVTGHLRWSPDTPIMEYSCSETIYDMYLQDKGLTVPDFNQ